MSISTVTSEALQLKLRQLLPSQQGFSTDLSASDTIIPVIDLTRAAEGSDVPEVLQTALAFGSQTAFSAQNSTVAVANTAGFYRIFGTASAVANVQSSFQLTDGSTTKIIWSIRHASGSTTTVLCQSYDFVVFLRTGDTLNAVSAANANLVEGSSRQIADVNGVLVNPVGFTPQ